MDLAIELQRVCGAELTAAASEAEVTLGLHLVEEQTAEQAAASETQLRQMQMLEAVSNQTGDIAHQLNNVLSIIYGHADLIEDTVGPQDGLMKNVASIRTAVFRAADLVRQLNLVRDMVKERVASLAPQDPAVDLPKNLSFPILQPWKFENWGFQETAGAAAF
jgi:signal transduction histidine kinase